MDTMRFFQCFDDISGCCEDLLDLTVRFLSNTGIKNEKKD